MVGGQTVLRELREQKTKLTIAFRERIDALESRNVSLKFAKKTPHSNRCGESNSPGYIRRRGRPTVADGGPAANPDDNTVKRLQSGIRARERDYPVVPADEGD